MDFAPTHRGLWLESRTAISERGSHAPFSQQGRAVAANSTFRWSHFAYASSRRTSSSVCASLISDRHSGLSPPKVFSASGIPGNKNQTQPQLRLRNKVKQSKRTSSKSQRE